MSRKITLFRLLALFQSFVFLQNILRFPRSEVKTTIIAIFPAVVTLTGVWLLILLRQEEMTSVIPLSFYTCPPKIPFSTALSVVRRKWREEDQTCRCLPIKLFLFKENKVKLETLFGTNVTLISFLIFDPRNEFGRCSKWDGWTLPPDILSGTETCTWKRRRRLRSWNFWFIRNFDAFWLPAVCLNQKSCEVT